MLRFIAIPLMLIYPLVAVQAQSAGDPQRGEEKAQACAACHGTDGNSSNPVWPKLAGQHPDYIVSQLQAFKSGDRKNDQMAPMVQGLSEQDMQDLAAWYASQSMSPGGAKESDDLQTAETLYRAGQQDDGMPACIACHGPRGNGIPYSGYPKISGQHAEYTTSTLKAYRSGDRQGSQARIMQDIAEKLTAAEIEALANYISGLH